MVSTPDATKRSLIAQVAAGIYPVLGTQQRSHAAMSALLCALLHWQTITVPKNSASLDSGAK